MYEERIVMPIYDGYSFFCKISEDTTLSKDIRYKIVCITK